MSEPKAKIFLSHNSGDKAYATSLASVLQLLGAYVWFDAWHIKPGDSIPTAINHGLQNFEVFLLLWSSNAACSKWVENEMNGALTRLMSDPRCKLVPILLDNEPLPFLIHHLRYVDAREGRPPMAVARELLGIETERALRLAIQETIENAELNIKEFWGAGVFVCCPQCGAESKYLRGFQSTDDVHDRTYVGAECTKCGWGDGSEL